MDKIIIRDLNVWGIIGVEERERQQPQLILINLELITDLSKAGKSDKIEDSVDYAQIVERVSKYARNARKYTVEALANDISQLCLEEPSVQRVSVRVEKPNAIEETLSVGVEIERSN